MNNQPERNTSITYAALAYLCFVIYGSLVPLDFRPVPWEQAVTRFGNIPYLSLGIASRADWVANILLFIPLAFFWNGVLAPRRSVVGGIVVSLLVMAGGMALSIGIEFSQIFFPPRTVSLNDILAETIGTLLGVLLWWVAGQRFRRWLTGWMRTGASSGWPGRLLYTYLFGLFVYSLLPLDLTLSPVEIFHKWRAGRVMLIPFGYHFADPAQALYDLLSDVAIWVPAGLLYRIHNRARSQVNLWLVLVGAAALLEGLQLFVYSRVSDVTDILTAGAGAALGIWMARYAGWAETSAQRNTVSQSAIWVAAALAWIVVLMAVFWYPFDFRTDGGFVRERFALFAKVPFETYYYGTEFRAATELLHKILFFMPLGAVLALALRSLRHRAHAGIARFFGLLAVFGVPLAIELGQALLPGKYPDTTDWLLEALGAVLGYSLAARLMAVRTVRKPAMRPETVAISALAPSRWQSGGGQVIYLLVYGVPVAAVWLITHSPAAPYNVRELLGGNPLLSVFLFSALLYWTCGVPAWIARHSELTGHGVRRMLLLLVVHAGIAWVLLRSAVPMESVHDIVGSPVLDWPWEWELLGRFLALYGVVVFLLTGGALLAMRLCAGRRGAAVLYWFSIALVLLPLSYWVVVRGAATDNLTELMRDDGSIVAGGWLALYLLVIGLAGAVASRWLARCCVMPWGWMMFIVAGSLPLGYMLFNAATEPMIVKYGQVFSAMQFLFSQDRSHYANGIHLLLRYAVFQIGLTALVMLTQYPFWRNRVDAAPAVARPGKARSNTSGSSMR